MTEQGYPTTKLAGTELRAAYADNNANHVLGLRAVANLAIEDAIDSGQLMPKDAYLQCQRELLHAEQLLESLGYRRAEDGTWNEPQRRMAKRPSMTDHEKLEYAEKVAEAVRQACLKCFTNQSAPAAQAIRNLHLPSIIVDATQAFQASQSRG